MKQLSSFHARLLVNGRDSSLGVLIRRALPLLAAGALAGCVHTADTKPSLSPSADYVEMYAAKQDGNITVPAVDVSKIDPRYLRHIVDYDTDQPPGTIVVDPYHRFLYLILNDGKAVRYGVGVARAGMQFKGNAHIGRKAHWPHWTPTSDMIKRDPKLYKPLAKGLDGGLRNPLGARALYLYKGGKDTLYRLHGTTEPWSIGKSVSSGCIRLFDQDIIDLYKRVPKGAHVVVLGPDGKAGETS